MAHTGYTCCYISLKSASSLQTHNTFLSPLLFVHLVTEAHRVDHSEAKPNVALVEVIGLSPQLHLRLKVGRFKVFKICIEQSVHQS